MSRLQDHSKPSASLARSFDGKVLGYTTALFVVLPFLVLYVDGSVTTFVQSVQSDWGLRVATAITAMGYGLADAAIAAVLLVIGLKAGRPREAIAGKLGLLAVITGSLSAQVLKICFVALAPLLKCRASFSSSFLAWVRGPASFPSPPAIL